MRIQTIRLQVINSPTILQRVIQIIKRRRINIREFVAREFDSKMDDALIIIELDANDEQHKLLLTQFEKQVDVISVNK